MDYPASFRVTEKRVRKKGKKPTCPHNMAFPAMMSALKGVLGLPQRLGEIEGHGRIWESNLDYFFQMGISCEGFGLFFDLPHAVLQTGLFDGGPLADCFAAEGIRYRLAADETVLKKDLQLEKEDLQEQVCCHLSRDLPLVLLYHGKSSDGLLSWYNNNQILLVLGYENNGNTVRAYPFSDGHTANRAFQMMKNSKLYPDWRDGLFGILFVDGLCEPADRREISLKALQRGYEMMTAAEANMAGYGFGNQLYRTWMRRIDDDDNYRYKKYARRYIHPEEFDLAERRCYTAEFFAEAQTYLGQGCLQSAAEAFRAIHDAMWEVHRLAFYDVDSNRSTRNKILNIIRQCKELENQAMENIGGILNR